jgi:hypothetical protein
MFWPSCNFCILYFIFFAGTGVWSQGLSLARQLLYHLSNSASYFLCQFFKIGSHELFAQASFKPQSSCSASWVVRITGVHCLNLTP